MPEKDATPELLELRRTLGCFVTGVTVVATRDGAGSPRGITANSFTSVSLEPPLILVCIDHRAASCAVFRDCTSFAVSILGDNQQAVSQLFASPAASKFDRVAWHPGATGAPVIDGTVAWLECVPHGQMDAGDHLVLLGRVVDHAHKGGGPLGYCRGNYLTFDLEQRAVLHPADRRIHVGCILDAQGRVLLSRRDAAWALPTGASAPGAGPDPTSLRGLLQGLGAVADLGFLFSVFEGPGKDEMWIFYRGELASDPDHLREPARLFDYASIPWSGVVDTQRVMLRRYVEERSQYEFGVYVGSSRAGLVTPLSERS